MEEYDDSYRSLPELLTVVNAGPATTWLIITEGWCGDPAFNVPLMEVLAQQLPDKVKLRLVLGHSNSGSMDTHLTDSGRSIPKLIVLSDKLEPLCFWGPRSAGLQQLTK